MHSQPFKRQTEARPEKKEIMKTHKKLISQPQQRNHKKSLRKGGEKPKGAAKWRELEQKT